MWENSEKQCNTIHWKTQCDIFKMVILSHTQSKTQIYSICYPTRNKSTHFKSWNQRCFGQFFACIDYQSNCILISRCLRRETADTPVDSTHRWNRTPTSYWPLLWKPLHSWVSCCHGAGRRAMPSSQVSGGQTKKGGSKICYCSKTGPGVINNPSSLWIRFV